MTITSSNLASPHPEALLHSTKLLKRIRAEITANGGAITFARFMQLALYAPGLGYYSAGLQKFGVAGDFVTAPEISALFSRCLARQCEQVLPVLGGGGSILEFGAGSGIMAADLLLELERSGSLPEQYLILEISAELRQRQQKTFAAKAPHLLKLIKWLDRLPEQAISGVILANEVLDAMPVHRFHIDQDEVNEFYVTIKEGALAWALAKPSDPELIKRITELSVENAGGYYESEINLLLPGWIRSLSDCLKEGLILLMDYGFPRHEYYHPQRSMGTLMCHYQHRAHTDPLLWPGLQDITAHVDFTAVAEAAVSSELRVAGFTNQAAFLLACGLTDFAQEQPQDPLSQLKLSQQIQMLTSPSEMGELCKTIALTRSLAKIDLIGFISCDQRHRL